MSYSTFVWDDLWSLVGQNSYGVSIRRVNRHVERVPPPLGVRLLPFI